MAVSSLLWKLASPYDAYVSHVSRLSEAMARLDDLAGQVLGHEAGLKGSMRLVAGDSNREARLAQFRERLGEAASELSDEAFEEFLVMLGSGDSAVVEADRARAVSRIQHSSRGLEEYFAIAAHELAILEKRGFNPSQPDVARQLRDNGLPSKTTAEYAHELHELGAMVGKRAG